MAVERELTIRGQRLSFKEWGSPDQPTVLALHGWLDNANSFDALASQLPGVHLIAVDLPGHGLSGSQSIFFAQLFRNWADRYARNLPRLSVHGQ